jgi:catechol 2,3-dioxygenase-like lactoylglutathione lyase family enzyme
MVQLSFNRVVVFSPDLHRARVFFEDVLGLRFLGGDERAVSFEAVNFVLSVFLCDDIAVADRYSHRPGVSVAFTVPSLELAMSELAAKGVQFLHSAPNTGPLGRYVAFTDPFGTVFELME